MNSLSNVYPPRILLILPVEAPSATIYISKPLRELERQKKLVFDKVLEENVSLAQVRASDIVVFCRNREPGFDWILQECLASGIPTVYDLDDNFWEVPRDLHYASYFRAPHRIAQLERYLTNVDVVRVYSPRLFEKVQAYSDRVRLVNPCIDLSLVPKDPLPQKDTRIRMTYVTGRGKRDALLNLFQDDLERILNEYPERVEFYWWAEIPERFQDHPASKQVPILHDYAEFLHYLSHEGFDIGLAPLTSSSFNLSKTNTKFRDYGACRVAGIYSDVSVYGDVVNEHTGLLVDEGPGAWYQAIKRLIEEPELRRSIQETAYQFVYDHYRQEFVEHGWEELIDSLLNQKEAAPRPAQGLQLSIGSREQAPAGTIVLASTPAPGVNLIAQPDCLPLASNSIGRVLLENIQTYGVDPEIILGEAYRVARHAAQFCAVLPYTRTEDTDTGLPDHRLFNERTPGLWTPVEPPVYDHEDIALSLTAEDQAAIREARPAFDLRTIGLEFFYRPEFLYTDSQQRRKLRREVSQAVDFMLLKALVVKEELLENEIKRLTKGQNFFEPAAVTGRRMEDQSQFLKTALDRERERYETQLAELKLRAAELEQKASESQALAEFIQSELESEQAKSSQLEASFDLLQRQAQLTAMDLDSFRNRRVFRIVERVLDRSDVSSELPAHYRRLYDDSLIFTQDLSAYVLQPSKNLQRVPFLAYPIAPGRPYLCEVHLAPVLDILARAGSLGIEIVSGAGEILVHSLIPAEEVSSGAPAVFRFAPIASTAQGSFELRVFVREFDVPVRIFEWRRYFPLGAGPVRKKAFCGFSFCEG